MKNNFLRVFFSCTLSLFIAILSLFGGLCHYVQNHVCNKSVLLQTCINSGFTQQIYEEIRYEWENLIAITGITEPKEIMSVLIPKSVQADVLYYFSSSYTGTVQLQTEDLRSQLDEKIRNYAYTHNVNNIPEEALEQNITDLTDACLDVYINTITIPLLPTLLSAINRLPIYLHYGMILAFIGVILFLLFLFFLQHKRRNILYYTTVSFTTGGILMVGFVQLAAYYEIILRIPLNDSALKALITAYLQGLLDKLQQYGYLYLAISGILLTFYLIICLVKKNHSNIHTNKANNG